MQRFWDSQSGLVKELITSDHSDIILHSRKETQAEELWVCEHLRDWWSHGRRDCMDSVSPAQTIHKAWVLRWIPISKNWRSLFLKEMCGTLNTCSVVPGSKAPGVAQLDRNKELSNSACRPQGLGTRKCAGMIGSQDSWSRKISPDKETALFMAGLRIL